MKPTKNDWLTYSFTGLFYKNGDTLCRRELHIKKSGDPENPATQPDLLVIMMNPGGSYPVGNAEYNDLPILDNKTPFVPTIPDLTQFRVIEFMEAETLKSIKEKKQFNYAIVLNLTDICEKDSKAFVKNKRKKEKVPSFNPNEIKKHSIFNETLICYETSKYNQLPVLLAWGVRPAFDSMIVNANKFLASCKKEIYGFRKQVNEKNTDYFYHPLASNNWLENVQQIWPNQKN